MFSRQLRALGRTSRRSRVIAVVALLALVALVVAMVRWLRRQAKRAKIMSSEEETCKEGKIRGVFGKNPESKCYDCKSTNLEAVKQECRNRGILSGGSGTGMPCKPGSILGRYNKNGDEKCYKCDGSGITGERGKQLQLDCQKAREKYGVTTPTKPADGRLPGWQNSWLGDRTLKSDGYANEYTCPTDKDPENHITKIALDWDETRDDINNITVYCKGGEKSPNFGPGNEGDEILENANGFSGLYGITSVDSELIGDYIRALGTGKNKADFKGYTGRGELKQSDVKNALDCYPRAINGIKVNANGQGLRAMQVSCGQKKYA